eukprot:1148550-Pelagomonas_calceolata.AAC.4
MPLGCDSSPSARFPVPACSATAGPATLCCNPAPVAAAAAAAPPPPPPLLLVPRALSAATCADPDPDPDPDDGPGGCTAAEGPAAGGGAADGDGEGRERRGEGGSCPAGPPALCALLAFWGASPFAPAAAAACEDNTPAVLVPACAWGCKEEGCEGASVPGRGRFRGFTPERKLRANRVRKGADHAFNLQGSAVLYKVEIMHARNQPVHNVLMPSPGAMLCGYRSTCSLCLIWAANKGASTCQPLSRHPPMRWLSANCRDDT